MWARRINTALPLLLQEVGTAESEIEAAAWRDSETCRMRWDVRVYYSRVSSHGSTESIVARAITSRPASKNSFWHSGYKIRNSCSYKFISFSGEVYLVARFFWSQTYSTCTLVFIIILLRLQWGALHAMYNGRITVTAGSLITLTAYEGFYLSLL